jgi:pyridoxine 5-phosphate synthase
VLAHELGLEVHAGHGLDYDNVAAISRLPHLTTLNIGYSLIAESIFSGLATAVREMKLAISAA